MHYLLFDILLNFALLETVVWEGDSHWLFLTAILLSLGVLFLSIKIGLFLPKPRLLSSIGMMITLLGITVVGFQEWAYQEISPNEFIHFGSKEILIFLNLGILVYRLKNIVSFAAFFLFCFITFKAFLHFHPAFQLNHMTEPELNVLLLLLFLRLSCGTGSPKKILSPIWARCSSLAAGIAVFISLFNTSLLSFPPLKVPDLRQYRVNKEFVIPLLVSEDPIFLYHSGVDFLRLRNAVRESLERGAFGRGGSTLSMQLAKVMYLSYEKTLLRKFRQIVIAFQLELRYSKSEIMAAYLETVPYGEGVKGLQHAARVFYDIEPGGLSSQQSIPLVLSIYNPVQYQASSPEMPKEVLFRKLTIEAHVKKYREGLERMIRIIPWVR